MSRRRVPISKKPDSPSIGEVLDAIPSLVSYVNSKGIYLYMNASYEKWFGVQRSELLGKSVAEVLGRKAFRTLKPFIKRVLSGEFVEFESDVNYQSGHPRYVRARYLPHKNSAEKIVGFYAVVDDITSLKASRLDAEAKELELRVLVESMLEGVILHDKDGGIARFNQSAQDLLSLSSESIAEGSLSILKERLVQEDFTPFPEGQYPSRLAISTGAIQKNRIIGIKGMRNQIKWLSVTAVPLFNKEEAKPHGCLVTINDVTFMKEAQGKLLHSAKMSSLGEMASGIAHEINNPLSIIKGRAYHLRGGLESGREDLTGFKKELEKIEATVDRIARIVKGLQSFARDSERDPMEKVAVSQIIGDTLEFCRERFHKKEIEFTSYSVPGLMINCRSVQISQVLLNLLNNAYDAVENLDERWVEIRAARVKNWVEIAIKDSGTGIPCQVVEKMMQPFFTTKDVGRGTGLGLSIAKGIVEEHGGDLRYDPSASSTRFVVRLPLVIGRKKRKRRSFS